MFYEAVGRTIEGFVGAIARKDPTIEVPAKLEGVITKATADGLTLDELTKQLASEAILMGRVGAFLDIDDKQEPFVTVYPVETIINWSDDEVILSETAYERDSKDRFKTVAIEQYRQLWLNNGVYTVTVWRKTTDEQANVVVEWRVVEEITPLRRGKTLDAIPFFWLTPLGKTSRVEKPPLLGLVSVCMGHYRNSADLEWGRHFTGLPTLFISGYSSDTAVNVGSTSAILLPDANGTVGYAEFQGQGLQSLENALAEKEAKMAVLGAQVFVAEKKGVEAADTARIRTSGETSLLMGVVTAVEETLRSVLEFAAKWIGADGTVEVTLNRDFLDEVIDGPLLTAMVGAVQSGAMSIETFTYRLQQSEMLPPDTVLEDEVAVVKAAQQAKADEAIRVAKESKPVVANKTNA